MHEIDESPNVINLPGGWIQNTNNWPHSAAGPDSPEGEGLCPLLRSEQTQRNLRGVHRREGLEGFGRSPLPFLATPHPIYT
ncbi:MAG: hypothetical protein R2712_14600 [Vicinamibacterales bacterium]